MTILVHKIHNFTESLQSALADKNYFSALTLSLTLPDICSKLENPQIDNTGTRYVLWFNQFLSNKYQSEVGPNHELHTFLSGGDFYALRCAFLHQGGLDITTQRAQEVLNNFVFIEPQIYGSIHMNHINDTL
jgi:hypothetical protein